MCVSIFYKCFTLVVLLGIIDLCVCFLADQEYLIPEIDKTASRRDLGRQYQPRDGEDVDISNDSASGKSDVDPGVDAKREASQTQGQDLTAIRERFSLGKDLDSIAQENFLRQLARGSDATEVEDEEEPSRNVAARRTSAGVLEENEPHLNYYYPSIGNDIGPMAATYIRHKRHGETDYPGYEMKLHLQKREALFDDGLNAEKEGSAFHVKRVIQKPIAIDADSVNIDEPVSTEWQDDLDGRGNAFSRRRRRSQRDGNELSEDDSDEEGAANFIHYQIEKLKGKVKREFEQGRKMKKRSKSAANKSGNEKRDTAEEARSSPEVRREFVPSSGTKRRRQAVVMDLSRFGELDSDDALGTNVKRELEKAKNFNNARFKSQGPLRPDEDQSLSPMTKRDTGRFHIVEKAENDVDSRANEELTKKRAIREPTVLPQDEWKMAENADSSTVDKAKRKRNVEAFGIDRSIFENDEFAPAPDYNFENTMRRRRRREAGGYLAGNNLTENQALMPLSKGVVAKRENVVSKYDDFSKENIQKNEADIQKMKQELDNLFKTINISKAQDIIPSSNNQNEWKKFPKNKMTDEDENGHYNGKEHYMEVQNENAPEYTLDNNEEKVQATHRVLESLDDSSEREGSDVLKPSSASSKGLLSASRARCHGSIEDRIEEEEVDELEQQAEELVNRRQMGSSSSDHRERSSLTSCANMRPPKRRLLSFSETSIAESLVGETKRNSGTGFYSQMMSNVQDELQEDKSPSGGDTRIRKSERIKESADSHSDASLKSERGTGSNFIKNREADAPPSGGEEQWLEKQSRHDISYGRDNENDVSLSSQQVATKGKRQVNTQDNAKPVKESSKTAIQDTQATTSNQQDINLNSDVKRIDSRSAEKLKAVDRELEEHNQRAIEFRNMDVKVGPQVAEVAKLIEQSHQKENSKERTGDNTLASLTHTDNDHSVRKKAEYVATSAALNEERKKRSSHHHSGNNSSVNGMVAKFPIDGYSDVTGDLDIDLIRYFNGAGKDSHRTPLHSKNKISYKPVVDWQAGDRERFAQLQAHRKLNGCGCENKLVENTATGSDNSNENYNERVSFEQSNNNKFSGDQTNFGESRDQRSNSGSQASLSQSAAPKTSQHLTLKNSPNNLSQRRKLFELLRITKSKLNPEMSAASDDVAAVDDDGGASWLELLLNNQAVAEELKKKANTMESERALKGVNENIGLKDKSGHNEHPDELHNQVKKGTKKEPADRQLVFKRHQQVAQAEQYGAGGEKSRLRRQREGWQNYVIKKRDLGTDLNDADDRTVGRVYYGSQFRDNNFHKRKVPAYGLPTADLFNKWDVLGDVHGFSKSLFNNLQSNPDENIVAGFDSEGNYISPIALDRVKRMRRRKRRRRGAPGGHEERRRRRRQRRRTFLFPNADPVEEFFSSRPERAAEDAEEDEGEAAPRAERLRERRAVAARRDEKGWPVTRNGGCAFSQRLSAVALAALHLGRYAS